MTDEERERAEARARKMAQLDPGLCASAGGEPYRERLMPQSDPQPATSGVDKPEEEGARSAPEVPVA